MKFLTPLILFGLSIAAFFLYINPTYTNIGVLRKESAQLQVAVANAEAAQTHWQELRTKYDSISNDDLQRLQKFLPDRVDTIKLAVDLTALTEKYSSKGLRNIRFSDSSASDSTQDLSGRAFGSTAVSFDVSMSYDTFITYLSALEQSLQFMDITSISFQPTATGDYNFALTLKTYWLK